MRNPNRIEPFLKELEKLWNENPDLRFFQLLFSVTYGQGDGFYIEDDKALELIKGMLNETE